MMNKEMKMVKLAAVIGTFFSISVIGFGCLAAVLQNDESKAMFAYAGFSEISPAKNHFILVGDTQRTSPLEFWREQNDKERHLIENEIAGREPAFVVHLGDLTTHGSSKKEWQEFDDLNQSLREKKIPYFPILGNHELYGNDEKALGLYFSRFPHLEQRRWYSFTWKNLGLIMFDSIFSTLTKEENESQVGIDYTIVCCREPPFTNSRVVHPNKRVKASFADPFVRFQKTCLFFSGHSHSYERFQIEGKFFIVSGGGGGPRHKVNADPIRRSYDDLYPGSELRFFHFCEIEESNATLIFRVMRLGSNGSFAAADSVEFKNGKLR